MAHRNQEGRLGPRAQRWGLCGASLIAMALTAAVAPGAAAQTDDNQPPLSAYFGWTSPRIVVIGDGAGPIAAADVNADGRTDLVAVNNRISRIDVFLQRQAPRSESERRRPGARANDLPPSPWFDRVRITAPQRVRAVAVRDLTGDGRPDLIYASADDEVVVLAQEAAGTFEQASRRRIRGLTSSRSAFAIADLDGDGAPELATIAEGRVIVAPLGAGGSVGEPIGLGAPDPDGGLVAVFVEDFNGDGAPDLLAVAPSDQMPLRFWFADASAPGREFAARFARETRFSTPSLREVEPIRLPGEAACRIAIIERQSGRIALQSVASRPPQQRPGDSSVVEPSIVVYPFAGQGANRDVAIADIDGDGALDLLAAEPERSGVSIRRGSRSRGFGPARVSPAFLDTVGVAVGSWVDAGPALFLRSEQEQSMGVTALAPKEQAPPFPTPLPLATRKGEPAAIAALSAWGGPALAVAVRERRTIALELHRPGQAPVVTELTGFRRPPERLLAGDFNRDGAVDLLLLTADAPPALALALDEPGHFAIVREEDMPSSGLIRAASPSNAALYDVDGDGFADLLIAEQALVRACSFDEERGWRVIEQIVDVDPATRFTAVAAGRAVRVGGGAQSETIAAVDSASRSLALFTRRSAGEAWTFFRRLRLEGLDVRRIALADVSPGDADAALLTLRDGVAVVALDGAGARIDELDAFRAESDRRQEHELAAGDINGDGFTDLIALDAGEQMCEVFAVSQTERLLLATEFQVFRSRLFAGGEAKEFEPSQALIADFTGDGAADLALLAHDRVIIYPQMTRADADDERASR